MALPPTNTLSSAGALPDSAHSNSTPASVHAPHWQTQLWQRLVVTVMVRAAVTLQALSPAAAIRFGNGLGNLAYRVAGRQRNRALANLHLAYGEKFTPAQRDTKTRQIFKHFGRNIVDFLRAPARSTTQLSQIVSSEGWEHIETALRRGKGVVLVTGHIGNWELMGRWLATVKNIPLTVVAREPDNPALASYLRNMRENAGFSVLSKGESARGLLRALRRGEAIVILADQNSGDVFTPFFGIPTGTPAGPATLAIHSGAALIPIYCVEMPDHSYHVTCLPPLNNADSHTTQEGRQTEIVKLTREWNEVMESLVRQYPDQWLWLHNRWKSAFEEKHRSLIWEDGQDFLAARERWKIKK